MPNFQYSLQITGLVLLVLISTSCNIQADPKPKEDKLLEKFDSIDKSLDKNVHDSFHTSDTLPGPGAGAFSRKSETK